MARSKSVEVKAGDVFANKYRVERVIGAGGMGVVVEAEHLVLHDRVALKFLNKVAVDNEGGEAFSARFLREAQAAARIKSPHVARVIDLGTLQDGQPFMVMEYLEGEDLGKLLARRDRLEPELAVGYVLQACEALAAAHSVGVIHRDIKPGNLFLTKSLDESPVLKVLDFGISKVANPIDAGSLTQTHSTLGTPLYMSPEQMRSARNVDARSDIWSLGVVLYELLSGRVPFQADTLTELISLLVDKDSRAPSLRTLRPELPKPLDAVVLRCLEKEVKRRYANVGAVAAALAPYGGKGARRSVATTRRILEASDKRDFKSDPRVRELAALVPTPAGEIEPTVALTPSVSAAENHGNVQVNTKTSFGGTGKIKRYVKRSRVTATAAAAVVVVGALVGWLVARGGTPAAELGNTADAAGSNRLSSSSALAAQSATNARPSSPLALAATQSATNAPSVTPAIQHANASIGDPSVKRPASSQRPVASRRIQPKPKATASVGPLAPPKAGNSSELENNPYLRR